MAPQNTCKVNNAAYHQSNAPSPPTRRLPPPPGFSPLPEATLRHHYENVTFQPARNVGVIGRPKKKEVKKTNNNNYYPAGFGFNPEAYRRSVITPRLLPRPKGHAPLLERFASVECKLGEGGFGAVYLARTLEDKDKAVAVKVMGKSRLNSPCSVISDNRVKNVYQERDLLLRVRGYKFANQLLEVFQSNAHVAFVLEFCEGGDLYDLSRRNPCMTWKQARFYTAEIATGLNHMHNLGIMMRDIKAENILLDAKGHCKIADFGLAVDLLEGNGRATAYCGNEFLMAPERRRRESYGLAADWYSLGVLVYDLMTQGRDQLVPWGGAFKEDADPSTYNTAPDVPPYPLCTEEDWGNEGPCRSCVPACVINEDANEVMARLTEEYEWDRYDYQALRTCQAFHRFDWDSLEMLQHRPPFMITRWPNALNRNDELKRSKFSAQLSDPAEDVLKLHGLDVVRKNAFPWEEENTESWV